MSGSKGRKKLRRRIAKALTACLAVVLSLCLLALLQVVVLKFVDPPFTTLTAWNWVRSKISGAGYRRLDYRWRPLREISPHLIKAVQAGEDQRFLSHHGFDFTELHRAVRDLLLMRRVRGASTISMQAARTVFLWPGRNWFRKSMEAYYTLLVEAAWGKKRIMEIYLNTVDWGPGIMGAEAASRRYFKTDASSITPSQAAMLAAILPSPHTWSPVEPSDYLRERQRKILKDMERMPLL